MTEALSWLSFFFGALALGALAFYALCLLGAWDFRRQRVPGPGAMPPISILKPLKGADPEMYESFRSHCLQDYPEYEIVFGVNDERDESVPFIERLRAEFPQYSIRLVVCRDARCWGPIARPAIWCSSCARQSTSTW
jgi:cellulose synthase/poly-beta-1,6-N-acetylglucosamine synthase-like glycosyltransferase